MQWFGWMISEGICQSALECTWKISMHPLLAVGVAALLAFWYQRRNKEWELKFSALRDVIPIIQGAIAAAITFALWRVRRDASPNDISSELLVRMKRIEELELQKARVSLEELALKMQSQIPIVGMHFGEPALATWRKIREELRRLDTAPTPEGAHVALMGVVYVYSPRFIREAAKAARLKLATKRIGSLTGADDQKSAMEQIAELVRLEIEAWKSQVKIEERE